MVGENPNMSFAYNKFLWNMMFHLKGGKHYYPQMVFGPIMNACIENDLENTHNRVDFGEPVAKKDHIEVRAPFFVDSNDKAVHAAIKLVVAEVSKKPPTEQKFSVEHGGQNYMGHELVFKFPRQPSRRR